MTDVTVHELGEDGESWIVEGTLDREEARGAVASYVRSCLLSGDPNLPEILEGVAGARTEVREDWYFCAATPPFVGDYALLTASDEPIPVAFAGVRVTL